MNQGSAFDSWTLSFVGDVFRKKEQGDYAESIIGLSKDTKYQKSQLFGKLRFCNLIIFKKEINKLLTNWIEKGYLIDYRSLFSISMIFIIIIFQETIQNTNVKSLKQTSMRQKILIV